MPIGYDTSGILRALSDHQLQSKDKFIFIIPATETERTRMTKAQVEQSFSALASRGLKLSYEFLTVDENDFSETFPTLVDKIIGEKEREIIVEIAGGLRVICLALFLATCILSNRIHQVYAIAESSSTRVPIPIPFSYIKMSSSNVILLREISQGINTMDQLSRTLAKDKSTLNRQLRSLANEGLVEQNRVGRVIKYNLTLFGSAYLANVENLNKQQSKDI